LLFLRPRSLPEGRAFTANTPHELFTQVIQIAQPQLLQLWEEGDRLLEKAGTRCPNEIGYNKSVGRSYYQCQPHFWECYWRGGVQEGPALKVDLYGQSYHVRARDRFSSLPAISSEPRHMQFWRQSQAGQPLRYGYRVELEVAELPGFSQSLILTDTCRDVYLPQRIYAYGANLKNRQDEGWIWDNFDRHLFLDKFYVSNQKINEWRLATNQLDKFISDRQLWHQPALLKREEQQQYCAFLGKRVLEAKLFDAATMPPADVSNPLPERIQRSQTPWHRDISKTFLGMARINPDFQLTPLDCQLAQVNGCSNRYFTTDSASWMGIHYAIGFYPEAFTNNLEPALNLKRSSKFLAPSSEWHELGLRSRWNGEQQEKLPVAFRCYEEVAL
jgi:hypothetical protein